MLCLQNKRSRSSHRRCSVRKGVLRKFTGKYLCQRLFFNKGACNFIKKDTLAQVFFCEFCEISKNTFFTEYLRATASNVIYRFRTMFVLMEFLDHFQLFLEVEARLFQLKFWVKQAIFVASKCTSLYQYSKINAVFFTFFKKYRAPSMGWKTNITTKMISIENVLDMGVTLNQNMTNEPYFGFLCTVFFLTCKPLPVALVVPLSVSLSVPLSLSDLAH